MAESTEEQRARIGQIAKGVADEVKPYIDVDSRKGEFPEEAVRRMQEAGLTRLLIPREYGGEDADLVSFVTAQYEFAKVDLGLANFISDQAVPSQLLRSHGTEEQKNELFPRVVEDGDLWCLAVTEPGAGSDLGSIETGAERRNGHYVINGHKCWASAGGHASLYVVLASTSPEERLRGLSAFLVERGADGFEVGREHPKMGWLTTSTTELHFDDVEVPTNALLGEEGKGFALFETALTAGRLGIGGQALGLAEAAYEYALNYAKGRKQFGRPIGDFQAIRFMLADMATSIEAGRLLTFRAAEAATEGDDEAEKLVAMTKYWLSDMAMDITTDAVQILGAAGYSQDHPVERMMRDAKGLQIADGTNQIMRVLVAREILS